MNVRRVHTEYPDEELWVTPLDKGFEVGIQLNRKQFTYLELSKSQLEEFRTAIDAALLDATYPFGVIT